MVPSCISLPTIDTSDKKLDIIVSIEQQKMVVLEKGKVKKTYPISTSKYGIGNTVGSKKTPLGKHQIVEKIGEDLPQGAVLKHRTYQGWVVDQNKPTPASLITSRILRLKGEEKKNSNTYRRCVYIHGTSMATEIGKPSSIGCVRMLDKHIIELYKKIKEGSRVQIIKEKFCKIRLKENNEKY